METKGSVRPGYYRGLGRAVTTGFLESSAKCAPDWTDTKDVAPPGYAINRQAIKFTEHRSPGISEIPVYGSRGSRSAFPLPPRYNVRVCVRKVARGRISTLRNLSRRYFAKFQRDTAMITLIKLETNLEICADR